MPPCLSFPVWRMRSGFLLSQGPRCHDPSCLLSEWQGLLPTPGPASGHLRGEFPQDLLNTQASPLCAGGARPHGQPGTGVPLTQLSACSEVPTRADTLGGQLRSGWTVLASSRALRRALVGCVSSRGGGDALGSHLLYPSAA